MMALIYGASLGMHSVFNLESGLEDIVGDCTEGHYLLLGHDSVRVLDADRGNITFHVQHITSLQDYHHYADHIETDEKLHRSRDEIVHPSTAAYSLFERPPPLS